MRPTATPRVSMIAVLVLALSSFAHPVTATGIDLGTVLFLSNEYQCLAGIPVPGEFQCLDTPGVSSLPYAIEVAADGTIYLGYGHQIYRMNPKTGAMTLFVADLGHVGQDFAISPTALYVLVLMGSTDTGSIQRVDLSSGGVSELSPSVPGFQPSRLTLRGDELLTLAAYGHIDRIRTSDGLRTTAVNSVSGVGPGLGYTSGIAATPNGDVWVCRNQNFNGTLIRIDLSTGAILQTVPSPYFRQLEYLDAGPDGTLYAAAGAGVTGNGSITRYDGFSSPEELLSSHYPTIVRALPQGPTPAKSTTWGRLKTIYR